VETGTATKLGEKYRDSGLLFVGSRGRPLNPSNLRNRDHVDLELPRFRLHDLRHLQATFLNAQRIDARHIADRLGHSRASFTQDRYVHADPRGQELAAAAANGLLTKTGYLDRERSFRNVDRTGGAGGN
jgi:integrase